MDATVDGVTPELQTGQDPGVLRAELPASPASARQARSAVRRALAAWGIDDPSGDAELLASELVANAAEHARGPISLALRRRARPDGRRGITCEVTDTSPGMPRQAGPDDDRGRGLAIVAALAADSGMRAGPGGKTAWFTFTLRDGIEQAAPRAQAEHEAGA
jgi:anti-sigma regulatory factor (Ser/Thr protein kinase)